MSGVIEPRLQADGEVTVDMGAPVFEPASVPFDSEGLTPLSVHLDRVWPLSVHGREIRMSVLSMGNPHAVQQVAHVDEAHVTKDGPVIENHSRFPQRVNAGFMEVVDRHHVRLRVWERGAGETLACGTGACAAAVTGIRRGLLDSPVVVDTRGGRLTIAWDGLDRGLDLNEPRPVLMTGPALKVYDGEIEI